jgi:hypothetical protein
MKHRCAPKRNLPLMLALTSTFLLSPGLQSSSASAMSATNGAPNAARSAPAPAEEPGLTGASSYLQRPPYTAAEFWKKVLLLINSSRGYVAKDRFEEVFGVRLGPVTTTKDGTTTYRLYRARTWYFDARLSYVVNSFKMPLHPAQNGSHSELYISWENGSFSDADGQDCVTDELVRTGLMATGWTSPWQKWGLWEEIEAAASRQRPADPGSPPEALPPPVSGFIRQTDEDAGHRDFLPRGRLDTTGDHPDSCVTGIDILGRP